MKKFLAFGLILLMGSSASAGFIDFGLLPVANQAASISYDGSGGPLAGLNIGVVSVTGENTAMLDGVSLPLSGTHLDFTTGAFKNSIGGAGWDFASGGSLTITGFLPAMNTPVVLFSGVFTQDTIVLPVGANFLVSSSGFAGSVNSDLAALFGSGSLPAPGALSIVFTASTLPGQFINSHAFNSGNLAVSDTLGASVPEPASAVLLAIGLGTIGFFSRKKLKK